MIEWTEEDDKRLMPFIEESRRYDEMYGTMSEEEFWFRWQKMEQKEKKKRQLKRKNITLNIARPFGKIAKKFMKI